VTGEGIDVPAEAFAVRRREREFLKEGHGKRLRNMAPGSKETVENVRMNGWQYRSRTCAIGRKTVINFVISSACLEAVTINSGLVNDRAAPQSCVESSASSAANQ
jgi:hypothetical protein